MFRGYNDVARIVANESRKEEGVDFLPSLFPFFFFFGHFVDHLKHVHSP